VRESIRKGIDRYRVKFERFEQVRRDVEKFDEVQDVVVGFDGVFDDKETTRKLLETRIQQVRGLGDEYYDEDETTRRDRESSRTISLNFRG
jgi:hypothetical protein